MYILAVLCPITSTHTLAKKSNYEVTVRIADEQGGGF
jgi:hypothetical protein